MEVQEFGKQNSRKIMLLPGNMMSWRQFEAVIPLLEKQYHVIAVSTDGYDDTGKTTFTTAEAMAEKLEQYIKNRMVPSTWCLANPWAAQRQVCCSTGKKLR